MIALRGSLLRAARGLGAIDVVVTRRQSVRVVCLRGETTAERVRLQIKMDEDLVNMLNMPLLVLYLKVDHQNQAMLGYPPPQPWPVMGEVQDTRCCAES